MCVFLDGKNTGVFACWGGDVALGTRAGVEGVGAWRWAGLASVVGRTAGGLHCRGGRGQVQIGRPAGLGSLPVAVFSGQSS